MPYTQGPWRVARGQCQSGKKNFPLVIHETKPGSIVHDFICTLGAEQWVSMDRQEEREANARLIAAAPEMLKALKRLAYIAKVKRDYDKLRIPVFRELYPDFANYSEADLNHEYFEAYTQADATIAEAEVPTAP